VFGHVLPHELPQHLRGGLVLATADFEELVVQSFFNPDANACVFDGHLASVGPMDTHNNETLWISTG
jgi:hypothetical protein